MSVGNNNNLQTPNLLRATNLLLHPNLLSKVNALIPVVVPVQDTPTFSPVAGTYTSIQSVTITSAGADAIYYTTDGSTPTTGSTLYSGPVSVAVSETLKAIAVKAGFQNSAVGTAVYVINIPTGVTLLTHTSATGASPSITTPAIDTSGASFLVVSIGYHTATGISTVTDSKGNTWIALTEFGTGFAVQRFFYAANPIVGAGHTFTMNDGTGAGDGSSPSLAVAAFSGVKTTAPFEAGTNVGNTSFAASNVVGAVTPQLAGDLYVGTMISLANIGTGATVDTGLIMIENLISTGGLADSVALAYLLAPSLTALNPTWNRGDSVNIRNETAVAMFKQA